MIRKIILSALLLPAIGKLSAQPTTGTIRQLLFRSVYVVPHNLPFKGTIVGGLSGIDLDPGTGQYYLISDDRSAINPARFYTARIGIRQDGIDTVIFQNVTMLLQPNGKPYPNSQEDPIHTPDPEAMRYNPEPHQLVWSSEGERIVKAGDTVLENPAITTIQPNGQFVAAYTLPPNITM
ncbi:MAG TPA: esterase-like activity of phytase family protein, partial [Sediminibacterium sp.]|nr:esterase-like activity of phytase family protein [Sediminibacterium sp.]